MTPDPCPFTEDGDILPNCRRGVVKTMYTRTYGNV